MGQKPTVVKDGVDFSKYRSQSPKEMDVVTSSIAEEMYEKNENPKNSYDAKSTNKNLKR